MADDGRFPGVTMQGGEQTPYQRIDQGLNRFFGPINRGIESVTGQPNPTRNLLLGLSAMRPGMARMPVGFRDLGRSRMTQGSANINNPMEMGTVPYREFTNPVPQLNRMPDFPMPGPGGNRPSINPMGPGGGPPSSDLILEMLRQRATAGAGQGALQQTRMDQARGLPFMQPPANRSTSPTGVSARDAFNEAIIKQIMGQ